MGYTQTVWVNDHPPPIDQNNLQHIEQGIANASLRTEDVNVVGASGATVTLPDPGTVQTITLVTLTANCTFTFPTAAAGKSFVVALIQGSGPFTATWPGTVDWGVNGVPTLSATAAKVDVFTFLCIDGTHWYGGTFGQGF